MCSANAYEYGSTENYTQNSVTQNNFSDYMKNMNLDERILVCFTNADWAYVTPIGFDYITYELFYDTWSLESKKELANLLETI